MPQEQQRRDRIARDEASFRSINETLQRGLHSVAREGEELAGFVCECARTECSELVHVPLERYEAIRGDSRKFLIKPGHDISAVEDVVEVGDRYAVVQKHEDVRGIVEAADERRPNR